MIKKIVITGPESTGKTTLAMQLAEALNTTWVPEFARNYLDQLNRNYQKKDLLDIAFGQIQMEDHLTAQANEFLICDTDLLTIKIWSEYKYGHCDERILNLINERAYSAYLLCLPDFPWQFDPQRESPEEQLKLLEIYRTELNAYHKPFFEISGKPDFRFRLALQHIYSL